MSVSTYTDVWCDSCGNWEQQATAKTGREARETAQSLGWLVGLKGGMDVCPTCVREGKVPTAKLGEAGNRV